MRTCRFARAGRVSYGALEGDQIRPFTAAPWAGGLASGQPIPLADVTLLAPVEPSKVVAVGKNYQAHALELGSEVPDQPLIFIKPSTAVIGPGERIVLPESSREVHHEAELAIVIGRTATRLSGPAEARQVIFGYTCVNDVTARDIQRAEGHFTRSKSFDTFCPVGPHVETQLDPLDCSVVCRVNGAEKQRASTRDMVFDPFYLVAFISQVMTLLPGDVVSTGTPQGVGRIERGDWVEVEVSGIGVLRNPVV
jgi:2-keto-4-pentenoate hydratase/2-oxohepta-3-ene-1,7-dioic acid hydratase in catechol pathway